MPMVFVNTLILTDLMVVQPPLVNVPTTVYTVLTIGLTTITWVVGPEFQEYVLAPLALKLTVPPTHATVDVAEILRVGLGVVNMA